MSANSPEGSCRLFQQYVVAGDISAVPSIYESEMAFLDQSREATKSCNKSSLLSLRLEPALSFTSTRSFSPLTLR